MAKKLQYTDLTTWLEEQFEAENYKILRRLGNVAQLANLPKNNFLYVYLMGQSQLPMQQEAMLEALELLAPELIEKQATVPEPVPDPTVAEDEPENVQPIAAQQAQAPAPPEEDDELTLSLAAAPAAAPAPAKKKKKANKMPLFAVIGVILLCLLAVTIIFVASSSAPREEAGISQIQEIAQQTQQSSFPDNNDFAQQTAQAVAANRQAEQAQATQPVAAPANNNAGACNVTCNYPGWDSAGQIGLYDYCAGVATNNPGFRDEYIRVAKNCGLAECPKEEESLEDLYKNNPYGAVTLELTLSCGE